MLPRELRIDGHGRGRVDRIGHADQLLARAREMARHGDFAKYADPNVCDCDHPGVSGFYVYQVTVWDACVAYDDAGLRLLADMVGDLDVGPHAWEQFDELVAAIEIWPRDSSTE